MSQASDLPLRLRRETRDLHERLERTFSLPTSLAQYRRQLAVMHGFVAPLEPALLRHEGLPSDLLHGRSKVPWVVSDLDRLDATLGPSPRPLCTNLPRTAQPLQAAGAMYVLEGSTLGGQMIARHVRETLGPDAPCSYHLSYGSEVRARWDEFRQFLGGIKAPDDQQEVVLAARETFEKLESWSKA